MKHEAHGFLDVVLVDLNDSGQTGSKDFPIVLTQTQRARAVRNCLSLFLESDECPCPQGTRCAIAGERLGADLVNRRAAVSNAGHNAGTQPAAADRSDDDIDLPVKK